VFGGARDALEFGGDFGDEGLPIERQSQTLVGLLTGFLPVAVIINQVPE
jgi:hypothetical protein